MIIKIYTDLQIMCLYRLYEYIMIFSLIHVRLIDNACCEGI